MSNRLIYFLFGCSVFNLSLSTVRGWNGQFQLSPYLDSNVQESLAQATPSYGLKLRGNLNEQLSRKQWKIYGDALGQTFMDGKFREESKWIARMESGFRYILTSRLHLTGQLTHFRKMFYSLERSYRWTEYGTYLQIFPRKSLTVWMGYVLRSSVFKSGDLIRFFEDNLEIRVRYAVSSKLSLEGTVLSGLINYQDYDAWSLENDTSLIHLDFDQEDEFTRGLLHLQYRGKMIVGIQTGFESVKSNSVIGKFNQVVLRIYLSGRLGESSFYHLVLQRVDKNYLYPALHGISGFRDPEERIQNRTYIQLERELRHGAMGFIQFSLLENETIYNQRYYDKKMVELGVKYDL